MTRPLALATISAGLGEPSSTSLLADRLGAATVQSLRDAGVAAEITRIEVRPLAHAIADDLVTRVADPGLTSARNAVTDADAIIAVTPTFSMSYSGLFKSFIDGIPERALAGVPTLLAATGGTVRHSMVIDHAMRPLFSYLGALITPTGVYAATEDWGADAGLDARIARAGRELATLVQQVPRTRIGDPFDPDSDGFEDFASLLGGA